MERVALLSTNSSWRHLRWVFLLLGVPLGVAVTRMTASQRVIAFVVMGVGLAWLLIIGRARRREVQPAVMRNDLFGTIISPQAHSDRLRRQRALSLAVGVFLVALNLLPLAYPTPAERVLGSAIILLSALPAWRLVSGRDLDIAFLPFFGAIYSVYYALPVFLMSEYQLPTPQGRVNLESFVEPALILAFAGLLVLLLGYYGPHQGLLVHVVPKVNMQWKDLGNLRLLALVMGMLGTLAYYTHVFVAIPATVRQISLFLADLGLLSIALLFVLQLRGRLGPRGMFLLWGLLVPARLLITMGVGITAPAGMLGLVLLMTYATLRRRLPWKTIALIFVVAFFMLAMKGPVRAVTWYGGTIGDQPLGERLQVYGEVGWDVVRGEGLWSGRAAELILERVGHLMVLAEMLRQVPAEVPFWGWESLYPLLVKPIPRLIYPGKPEEVMGGTFGHRYGLLSPNNFSTSYNLPHLVELYIDFGTVGVLVGMFLLGVLYRLIQHIFVHPRMGIGAVAAGVYVLTGQLLIENNLSAVLGGLFWQPVFLGCVYFLVKIVESARDDSSS